MRKFGIVHARYWAWTLENNLDDFSKVLGAYFLSCDHGNCIGCFKCPVAYISEDLGVPTQKVIKGISRLSECGFLLVCDKSRFILLPKYLKWNPLQNQNQVKGALNVIDSLPSTFCLHGNLLECLKKYTEQKYLSDDILNRFETISKGLANPFGTLSEPFRNPFETVTKPIRTKEKEKEKEKEREKDILYSQNFLEFWKIYPRKTGKGAAFKAYQNIKEPRPSLQTILDSIKSHEKTEQWQNKQFIPNPVTWLNQRRWEDEFENNNGPVLTPEEIRKKYGL